MEFHLWAWELRGSVDKRIGINSIINIWHFKRCYNYQLSSLNNIKSMSGYEILYSGLPKDFFPRVTLSEYMDLNKSLISAAVSAGVRLVTDGLHVARHIWISSMGRARGSAVAQ